MLIALALILVALILLICGDRGSRSVITTVIHGTLLLAAIYLIYRGLNPLAVTLCACVLIAWVTMFYQNEADIKSKAAFISVMAVLAVLLPLVFYLAEGSNSEGFSGEQFEITDSNGYTRNIDISMLWLQMSVMVIALMGTVIDTAVAITSSVYEIRKNGRLLTFGGLMSAAFTASRSILNTSIHTIFYIYMAEYLTLIIQYADEYPFLKLINSKSFCREFISVSVSGIGCCLVVPLTSVLGSFLIDRYFKSQRSGPKETDTSA